MVKSVDNVNEIQANDVPMNYPYAIFPKRDLSEIYVKSWNTNGTIQTLVFAPKIEKVKNGTDDTTESKIGAKSDVTEGILDRFDELSEKLDAITSGLNDGFYTANNAMLSGFNNLNTNVMQTGYGIQQAINADTVANMQNTNTLQAQLQNCCCENREATAQVRYDLATDTCAITNAIQNQTQQIMQNCNDNYRALHDELVQSQLDAKDAKILEQANAIQALNLAQSQATQNTYLINALKPTPIPSFPASNLYGGLYGGTCSGCNSGTVGF